MKQTHLIDTGTVVELAEGLHAMAQPLTVLRGAAGALRLSSTVTVQDRRYVEMCDAQAERLCTMLASLRDLLDAAQAHATEACPHSERNITSDCLKSAV